MNNRKYIVPIHSLSSSSMRKNKQTKQSFKNEGIFAFVVFLSGFIYFACKFISHIHLTN